jgi:hypothetical protein
MLRSPSIGEFASVQAFVLFKKSCPMLGKASALVQASACRHFMLKPIKFISENQPAALEIGNQQVITRVLEQSFGELFFERQLSPFKIRTMIWFRHGMLRFRL